MINKQARPSTSTSALTLAVAQSAALDHSPPLQTAGAGAGVDSVAAAGAGDPTVVLNTLFLVGFIPLIGLLGMGWVIETRGQKIPD